MMELLELPSDAPPDIAPDTVLAGLVEIIPPCNGNAPACLAEELVCNDN